MSKEKNLKLNPSKCEEIVITNCKRKHNIFHKQLEINNQTIPRVKKVKYLGLIISDNLQWTNHITKIVQKVNLIIKSTIYIIPYLEKSTRFHIFQTIIMRKYGEVICYAVIKKG